ncbi:MAG: LPS biosynthesis protein WbpP, partial [Armatimonadota bacterium]|nr:LPS biosynthesis protein WbpP [Armatimonadota bacterium]
AERAGGRVFNIGCGERFTLNTLVQEIATITGKAAEPQYHPGRSGDVRHSLADIGRAQEILHYQPTVRLREGLRKTVEWLSGV